MTNRLSLEVARDGQRAASARRSEGALRHAGEDDLAGHELVIVVDGVAELDRWDAGVVPDDLLTSGSCALNRAVEASSRTTRPT